MSRPLNVLRAWLIVLTVTAGIALGLGAYDVLSTVAKASDHVGTDTHITP